MKAVKDTAMGCKAKAAVCYHDEASRQQFLGRQPRPEPAAPRFVRAVLSLLLYFSGQPTASKNHRPETNKN